MKKMIAIFSLVAIAGLSAWAGDVITRNTQKLPAAARELIRKHFSDSPVSYIKIDSELIGGTTYEAVLTNGTEIEFDGKGNWTEVDCKKGVVPAAIIPASIRTYLKTEFPEATVKQIEKKRRTYEVELNNGLDLNFDLQGNLKRIDD